MSPPRRRFSLGSCTRRRGAVCDGGLGDSPPDTTLADTHIGPFCGPTVTWAEMGVSRGICAARRPSLSKSTRWHRRGSNQTCTRPHGPWRTTNSAGVPVLAYKLSYCVIHGARVSQVCYNAALRGGEAWRVWRSRWLRARGLGPWRGGRRGRLQGPQGQRWRRPQLDVVSRHAMPRNEP